MIDKEGNDNARLFSLRSLTIEGCENLRRLSGIENFTSLESLQISSNKQMSICEDKDDEDEMPWKSLDQSLRSLTYQSIGSMTSLPNGMQYLTSLQNLQRCWCDNLEALPEWIDCLSSLQSLSIKYCESLKSLLESMRNLTSLQRLDIAGCPYLEQGCEQLSMDQPKIKHIPHVDIARWR